MRSIAANYKPYSPIKTRSDFRAFSRDVLHNFRTFEKSVRHPQEDMSSDDELRFVLKNAAHTLKQSPYFQALGRRRQSSALHHLTMTCVPQDLRWISTLLFAGSTLYVVGTSLASFFLPNGGPLPQIEEAFAGAGIFCFGSAAHGLLTSFLSRRTAKILYDVDLSPYATRYENPPDNRSLPGYLDRALSKRVN